MWTYLFLKVGKAKSDMETLSTVLTKKLRVIQLNSLFLCATSAAKRLTAVPTYLGRASWDTGHRTPGPADRSSALAWRTCCTGPGHGTGTNNSHLPTLLLLLLLLLSTGRCYVSELQHQRDQADSLSPDNTRAWRQRRLLLCILSVSDNSIKLSVNKSFCNLFGQYVLGYMFRPLPSSGTIHQLLFRVRSLYTIT
jgi:hypothetical protein